LRSRFQSIAESTCANPPNLSAETVVWAKPVRMSHLESASIALTEGVPRLQLCVGLPASGQQKLLPEGSICSVIAPLSVQWAAGGRRLPKQMNVLAEWARNRAGNGVPYFLSCTSPTDFFP
jgi:hypothetical protein